MGWYIHTTELIKYVAGLLELEQFLDFARAAEQPFYNSQFDILWYRVPIHIFFKS